MQMPWHAGRHASISARLWWWPWLLLAAAFLPIFASASCLPGRGCRHRAAAGAHLQGRDQGRAPSAEHARRLANGVARRELVRRVAHRYAHRRPVRGAGRGLRHPGARRERPLGGGERSRSRAERARPGAPRAPHGLRERRLRQRRASRPPSRPSRRRAPRSRPARRPIRACSSTAGCSSIVTGARIWPSLR